MKKRLLRWQPCAVAAVFSLLLAAPAHAQYAYVQSTPAGYSSYGYQQPSSYTPYTPAYVYSYGPTTSYSGYGYSQPYHTYTYSQPYYTSNYSRSVMPAGQGYNWQSRTSYASYGRPAAYSPGYSFSQPYYYAGQGYGTVTQGVLPSGASYRAWQPPSRIR